MKMVNHFQIGEESIKRILYWLPILFIWLIMFYFVNRITINEYYMNFISYDIVTCHVNLSEVSQYRRTRDYVFKYEYTIDGKLYNDTDRIDNNRPETKIILSGQSNINLYVSPIFSSYTTLREPDLNTFDDWFGLILMTVLSIFTFSPILILFIERPDRTKSRYSL